MASECPSRTLTEYAHERTLTARTMAGNREYRMENELPTVNKIDEIHDRLVSMQGQRLKVKANMGRSRIIERTGTLVQAHPSLFVLEVDERRGRTARQSYQYVDVLTGTVELFDNETGERLFDCVAVEHLD